MNKFNCPVTGITTIVLCILFVTGSLLAQHKGTKEKPSQNSPFVLSISFNYVRPLPDLLVSNKGDPRSEDIYAGKTFGTDKGFGGTVSSLIRLGKRSNFYTLQSLAFNHLRSYDYLQNEATFDKGYADYNAWTFSAGLQYLFRVSNRTRLLAGVELNASMISGEADISLQSSALLLQYTFLSSFRLGYGIIVNREYMVSDVVGLGIGVKLQNLNAFNKNSYGTNEEMEFELRDEENPGLNFAGDKNFLFYTMSAGLNFHFGKSAPELNR